MQAEMDKERNGYRAHCLVLTYPSQGHINPMLEFSKRLKHKGVKVTLVTTSFISKTIHKEDTSIVLETISDGYDEGGRAQAESIQPIWSAFSKSGHKLWLSSLRNFLAQTAALSIALL
ncbi:hypothetical protein SLA2020_365360 [Shorea laevis]